MDLIDKSPLKIDQFEMLIFNLASSENCPCSYTELWNCTITDLFNIRQMVFIRDALDHARHKDQKAQAEANKPKGR